MGTSFRLTRMTAIRESYRSLINTGRTYAAFNPAIISPLLDEIRAEIGNCVVLDPMSGYGSLMPLCHGKDFNYCGLEFNPPQYFWQILNCPSYKEYFLSAIDKVQRTNLVSSSSLPRFQVSDDWFTPELLDLQSKLFHEIKHSFQGIDDHLSSTLSLAMLLPFSGRLSCHIPGLTSPHVKKGGTCILQNWQQDFEKYLAALRVRICSTPTGKHDILYQIGQGDARHHKFNASFSAMITSPPYPNNRDFASMFAPENQLVKYFRSIGIANINLCDHHIIGSNFVSGRDRANVKSNAGTMFLENLLSYKGSSRAVYDNKTYYVPYFSHYFQDLEAAYSNIASQCNERFIGYVNVVNNTARNLTIPVAEVVAEIWSNHGFKTEFCYAKEVFHVGTKNPRARGFKAKHMEYIVKVHR